MTLVAICLVILQRMHLSGTVMEIWRLKDNGVTTLTFWGHMTSSVTRPFDSRRSTSYERSIVTMHLSGTITEMWRFKDNGVMTLIFWCHVTSSVAWPFDSLGSISHRWSIVTMHLSSTVIGIWLFEVLSERLFQEQRSVVGRSVLIITLISYTPLRYVKERSARGTKNVSKYHHCLWHLRCV